MRLDEFYTVEPDASCWTLTYAKSGDINPDTGKPIISRDVSYHANLKQALLKYLDEALKPSTDAQDMVNLICGVEEKVERLVNVTWAELAEVEVDAKAKAIVLKAAQEAKS